MPREFVEYTNDLPIRASFKNIESYPIHWHNTMEIIYVLEGSISVTIETETHTVNKQEIEIINPDEAHSIKSITKDNKVLMFQIDPSFLNKYYDIENMFFYTDFSVEGAQKHEKYEILREHLSLFLCELAQKGDDYEEIVEDNLVDFLYHLINNFHYLIYDEDDLKENEVQFERYDRIIKYIYSNYQNKISIQDIARLEYLNSHYLSNEMKSRVGYSFNDFVNLTRVEESIKLLLDTDKTISEITEELGFSHTRYFNKHFKKYYKCTPMQYRKKYKCDEKTYNKLKQYEKLKIAEALPYLQYYLEEYPRYNYDGKIDKIHVDLASDFINTEYVLNKIINLGQSYKLLNKERIHLVEEAREELQIEYGILENLLSSYTNVFLKEGQKFLNWNKVKDILDFLYDLDIKPIIYINNSIQDKDYLLYVIKNFIEYFNYKYGETRVSKWKIHIEKGMQFKKIDEYFKKLDQIEFEYVNYDYKRVNLTYDTAYMVPYIINKYAKKENINFLRLFDEVTGEEDIDNELFFGCNGMITTQGIKKACYYAYYFLYKLGDEIIHKEPGYIVTKKGEDIQLLIYSYMDNLEELAPINTLYKKTEIRKVKERKFSVNIAGVSNRYKITRYKIDQKTGSLYSNWIALGKPQRLEEEEKVLLKDASKPTITLAFTKKTPIYNMVPVIKGYGATLINMEKVQNAP